jgi:hypothetical protein
MRSFSEVIVKRHASYLNPIEIEKLFNQPIYLVDQKFNMFEEDKLD